MAREERADVKGRSVRGGVGIDLMDVDRENSQLGLRMTGGTRQGRSYRSNKEGKTRIITIRQADTTD